MEFCSNCGKPLKMNGETAMCNCGLAKKTSSICSSEKINKPKERGRGVSKNKENLKGFPHVCKKCRHEFADVTELGAPYSDEANIFLFKCRKCKNVERDAYGTSNN